MASAAIRRSISARSLRLRRPLEQQGCLSEPRRFSSSVPTERHGCFPSADARSRDSKEQENHISDKKQDIYQRLSTKIDKLSDVIEERSRLLKQLEVQIQEDNKHGGAIDLTPWVVSIPVSFLLFTLYSYVQG